jgi:hypothetical protein
VDREQRLAAATLGVLDGAESRRRRLALERGEPGAGGFDVAPVAAGKPQAGDRRSSGQGGTDESPLHKAPAADPPASLIDARA